MLVNQRQNGGVFQLLGTYTFDAGTTTITLTDKADDGYVIADSIQLVPADAPPNTATWTVAIPQDGDYHVYAKWTSHANRASNAPYRITHANGQDTVLVNQQQNGGQFQLLATHTFNAGTATISLTDKADGYVIADSVMAVPITASPNAATYDLGLLQQNEYDVYAKWTAHANRASNTPYTIKHALGETTIQVNQQQNGGQYNLLGTFTLDNLSTMTITDNADGYVVADGIQLIPTGNTTSTITESGLYYIHSDNLDTPMFLTDNNQTKVWQSHKTPFGLTSVNEDVDGNGKPIVLNLRFPGQYYDSETEFYYNYFRYYDPSLGRYITSDPIGLQGGINTYAYVGGNPINFIDPFGLDYVVTLYQGQDGNIFNHIGIGSSTGPNANQTYGAGPDSGIGLTSPVPGHVKLDDGKPIATLTIPTTQAQDVLLNKYNFNAANDPEYNYSLTSKSCVDHVRGGLDVGDIILPTPMVGSGRSRHQSHRAENTNLPNALFEALLPLGTVKYY